MSQHHDTGAALITGASSGIGATYADRLARRGYDLVLVARNAPRLEQRAARLREATGAKSDVFRADLTQKAGLARVEQRLRDDGRITMLVNNAGIAASGPFIGADLDSLEKIILLNAVAVMRLAGAAAPGFVARGRGTVINIASVTALTPETFNGTYSGTKAFVLNFTQALQAEVDERGVSGCRRCFPARRGPRSESGRASLSPACCRRCSWGWRRWWTRVLLLASSSSSTEARLRSKSNVNKKEGRTMSTDTALTVPTQFALANGIRFAYRRWGKQGGIPLVFNQHFTGNLDNWDPAVLDGLAKEREVILFNNAGVASSTGEVPTTFAGMAKNAEAVHRCSGIEERLTFSASRSEVWSHSSWRWIVPNWFASSSWSEPPRVIMTQEMARATLPRRRRRSLAPPTTRPRTCGSRSSLLIRRRARQPVGLS